METSYVQRVPVAENKAARSIEARAFWEPGSSPVLTVEKGIVGRLEKASIPNESNGVLKMAFSYRDGKVFFMGVADPESFELTYGSIMKALDLLSDAVNNRTRERNYFKKYVELLMGDITEDEFAREIESNEQLYVAQPYREVSISDLRLALDLVENGGLMDVDSIDDMVDLFSFKYQSVKKVINAIRG